MRSVSDRQKTRFMSEKTKIKMVVAYPTLNIFYSYFQRFQFEV